MFFSMFGTFYFEFPFISASLYPFTQDHPILYLLILEVTFLCKTPASEKALDSTFYFSQKETTLGLPSAIFHPPFVSHDHTIKESFSEDILLHIISNRVFSFRTFLQCSY